MKKSFIYINSDIIFNFQIIESQLKTKKDIVLVVDNSYIDYIVNLLGFLLLVWLKFLNLKKFKNLLGFG